jgi:hypothetical protein
MRSKPPLLMALTLTGCFDYATLQTNECYHGTCSDGLICVGGFCELPLNRDLSAPTDDAGRPLDLYAPGDLVPSSDMSTSCADVGLVVGKVYACAGQLGGVHPKASQVCSAQIPGSKPCEDGTGTDSTKLAQLDGFFLCNAPAAAFGGPMGVTCSGSVTPMPNEYGWFGVGRPRTGINHASSSCSGMYYYIGCRTSPQWTCTGPAPPPAIQLDDVMGGLPVDGVLCCK